MSQKIYSNNNLKLSEKEELKMFNTIKRIHHFESNGLSYTAYINLDADMEVIDTTLPPISIKNDDNPTEYYDIDGGGGYIWLDCYLGFFEGDFSHLRTIFFDKQDNVLPLSASEKDLCEEEEDEDEDDIANAEYYDVPCDKLLAALIFYYCGIFGVVSLDFDKEHEVTDDLDDIRDFVIED